MVLLQAREANSRTLRKRGRTCKTANELMVLLQERELAAEHNARQEAKPTKTLQDRHKTEENVSRQLQVAPKYRQKEAS